MIDGREAARSSGRSVVENFATLLTGEAIARTLTFAATLYLGRRLGVERFGVIEVALALLVYLQLFVDAGLETFAARLVAAQPARRAECASHLIGLRLALASVALATVWLAVRALGLDADRQALLLTFSLAVVPSAFALGWAFQASAHMHPIAVGAVVAQTVYLGLLMTWVRTSSDTLAVAWAYVWSGAAGSTAMAVWFVYRYGLLRPTIGWAFARDAFGQSLPIAASRFLRAISFNFDLLLLGAMTSTLVVGYYAAAYRFVLIPILAFATFFTALFPVLVRQSDQQRRATAPRLLVGVAFVGVAFAAGLTLIAPPLLRLTLGDAYAPAAAPLRILAWSIPLVAIGGIFRQLLLVNHRQTLDLTAVAIGATLNVTLNLVWIPRYGLLGAAMATLAGEAAVLVAAAVAVWRVAARGATAPFTPSPKAEAEA